MKHRRESVTAALLALAPLGLGLIGSSAVDRALAVMPYLYGRVDLSVVPALAGLAGSLMAGGQVAHRLWLRRRDAARAATVQAESAEERRRFLRRLDHEMKNPVTAIRAGLANLAEAPTKEARGKALDSVGIQVLRISNLVSDLRKLAELETRSLERAPVDLAALLEEAVAAAQDRPGRPKRRITLTVPQAPWPLPHVPGDWDLLFLAVFNLLDNAVKFTQEGDTIEVRAFEDGSSVAIEVAETGPGIPEEDLPHVWEELYRGKHARAVPGSGLGLALVRAIVERHDGQASVRSRTGQGTVFTIRLPVR